MSPPKRLQHHRKILKALTRIPHKSIPGVVRHLPTDVIKAITEAALNILHGGVQLNKHDRDRLSKFKQILRKIDASCSKTKKIPTGKVRTLYMNQKGGFIPAILLPILSLISKTAIGAIAGSLIKKAID